MVGLVVLGTRLSFPDSIDDDAVPFPFSLLSFFCYVVQDNYMLPIVFIWRVFATVWVCNHDATLCYYFYYCYDMVLILRTFSLHIHESTLQNFSVT